ncbi:MAG: hypothetical protein ACOY94_19735 [Bacillota bacterium]
MRRLLVLLMILGLLTTGAEMASAGITDSDRAMTGDGGPAGGAVIMTKADFCAACRQAANNYLKTGAQPPTTMRVSDASAAVRNSVSSGKVDRLLRGHWPGGFPSQGIEIQR